MQALKQKMSKSITTFLFFIGFISASIAYVVIDIYTFDHYENSWGKRIFLEVSLWLIMVGAMVATLGFGIGVALFKTSLRKTSSVIVGVVFAAAVFGMSWAAKLFLDTSTLRQITVLTFLVLGSFMSAAVLAIFSRKSNRRPKQPDLRL